VLDFTNATINRLLEGERALNPGLSVATCKQLYTLMVGMEAGANFLKENLGIIF
jgi:hypothetical protein